MISNHSKQLLIYKLTLLRNQYQWDKLNSLYQNNQEAFNNEHLLDNIDHDTNNNLHSIEDIDDGVRNNDDNDSETMNENTFNNEEFQLKVDSNNNLVDSELFCIDCQPSYELFDANCQCEQKLSNTYNKPPIDISIELESNEYNNNYNNLSNDVDEEQSIHIKSSKKSSRHIILSDSEDDDNTNNSIYNKIQSSQLKQNVIKSDDTDSIIYIEDEDDDSNYNSIIDILSNDDDEEVVYRSDDSIYNSDIDKENNIRTNNIIPLSKHIDNNNIIDLTESPNIEIKKKKASKHTSNNNKYTDNHLLVTSTKKNKQNNISSTTKKKIFKSNCNERIIELYCLYNEMIFHNKLPLDLSITWNNRLLTTAGITIYKQHIDNGYISRTASIELSTKVILSIYILKISLRC